MSTTTDQDFHFSNEEDDERQPEVHLRLGHADDEGRDGESLPHQWEDL